MSTDLNSLLMKVQNAAHGLQNSGNGSPQEDYDSITNLADNFDARSDFVKSLFLFNLKSRGNDRQGLSSPSIPKSIVQFWDKKDIPEDVMECMETWKNGEADFSYQLFDDSTAKDFIREFYDDEKVRAYELCHHPAMRADYFRLAYLLKNGGIYIDADDARIGDGLSQMLDAGHVLCALPLMRDLENHRMVERDEYLQTQEWPNHWNCYINNAPLLANKNNEIVEIAFKRATRNIIFAVERGETADIHFHTGPENLTCSIFEYAIREYTKTGKADHLEKIRITFEWMNFSSTRWLNYKSDRRNWRTNEKIYME